MDDGISIRRLATTDSLEAITAMLHRAYGRLADMGLRYWATFQTTEDTALRIAWGECFVAVAGNALIGCIVFEPPTERHKAAWYRRAGIASLHQFGVEPAWQGRGVGMRLLAQVEQRAIEIGAQEIALDTAEPALHLIALYERHGYRLIETVQHEEANYRSVIMSKTLPASPRGQ